MSQDVVEVTAPPPPVRATPPTAPPIGLAATLACIKQDRLAHRDGRTAPGYRALRAYRFGGWRMTIPQPFRAPLSILYRMMYRRCRDILGIELPYSAKVGRGVVFEHQHGIVIHGDCVIGDRCIIRQGVTIGNKSPDRPHDAPTLGCDVNVGAGAKIVGKITLGDGCQVGANAVVVKDVPAGVTVVGIPAKPIGGRA
jgi:serine O-acetyltransferase